MVTFLTEKTQLKITIKLKKKVYFIRVIKSIKQQTTNNDIQVIQQ